MWSRCAAAGCFDQVVDVVERVSLCAGHKAALRTALGGGASSVVYYLTCDDMATVKIGTSSNPKQRMATHSATMSGFPRLVAAHPGGLQEEAVQHSRFKHLRLPGERETFSGDRELLDHVEAVQVLWPNWRALVDQVSASARQSRR